MTVHCQATTPFYNGRVIVKVEDNETNKLKLLSAALKGDAFKDEIGRQVVNVVREHLFAKDKSSPNKLGGKRTHFYAQAAKATNYQTTADSVLIQINSVGIRQRLQGGWIQAGVNPSCTTGKPTKYLTIPAIAQAYGRSACEFNNLRFVRFGKGPNAPAALVERPPGATYGGKKVPGAKSHRKQTGWQARVFFWLKRFVKQDPDETVLPTEEQIQAGISKAIETVTKQ